MDVFEERLAEAVRGYEHLYNTSRRDYKDVQKANNSWLEIAQTLCIEERVCRKKWRYLRDKFAKAKRRMEKKSGDAGGRTPVPPALYVSLQWLDAHIKHKAAATNHNITGVETGSGEDTEKEKLREQEQLDPLPVVSTSFSYVEPCQSDQQELGSCPKSKRQRNAECEPSRGEGLGGVRDEDELFLLSLLPSLRRLTIRRRMEVRMKFQQVLYAAEFEDGGTKNTTKTLKVDAVV